jgi:hypothetical protein
MKTTIFILMLGLSTLAGFGQTTNSSGSASFDEEKEKKAIIESINAETAAFFKRDYEEVIKYYVHADYVFHAWNSADGTYSATIGWPTINEKYIDYFKNNPVPVGTSDYPIVEKRNLLFKFFNSNLAFVTWDQYNSDSEMKTYRLSKETRIMEKQDGIWKIANMTAFWDYINLIPVESLK